MIELTVIVGLVFCMLSTIIMVKIENNRAKKRKELDKTTYDYALENAKKRNLELVITRAKIEELIRLEKENRRLEREIEVITSKQNKNIYSKTVARNEWIEAKPPNYNTPKHAYVMNGDTITSIAKRYNTNPLRIMELNRLNYHSKIKVGQMLRIR